MSAVVGRKDDTGKPWAGTVLAGFWQVLSGEWHDVLADHLDDEDEIAGWCACLGEFFDTNNPIEERVKRAVAEMPLSTLSEAITVGTYGAQKYERDNWLHVEGGLHRYYEAVGRHVRDVLKGDWTDAESGCVNLGHIAWGVLACATLARREIKTLQVGDAWREASGVVRTIAAVRGDQVTVTYDGSKPAELPLTIAEKLVSRGEWGVKL